MPTVKYAKDLQAGDRFRHENIEYRVHANFREGAASTKLSVTKAGLYSRMPHYLTLPNLKPIELI